MINIKKGTGHSLSQSDKIGDAKANEGVVAGMLVRYTSSGEIEKGVTSQGVDNLLGFAINSQTDGDSIASGKIGMYVLDGNTVVETDQFTGVIADYVVGARIGGDAETGDVKPWASGDRVIGYVEGSRTLPSQTIPATSSTPNWETTTLLGIKLAV